MARSNIGGTRGWLRGRVAQDIYQVTRDADGKRIQLVRSAEESRLNNNTMPQAMARMQMAMCMATLSQFKEIVDHSFEGYPFGQLSIAHFVHLNIPRIQNDCKEHWSQNFFWDYPEKGNPVPKAGAWTMATGSLIMPDFITCHSTSQYGHNTGMLLSFNTANLTKAIMKESLGLADEDYITHLAFAEGAFPQYNRLAYFRLYLNPNFPDSAVIDSTNYTEVFTYGHNCPFRSEFNAATGQFWFYIDKADLSQVDAFSMSCNVLSRWDGVKWCRNNATFAPVPDFEDYNYNWISPHDRFQSWFPEYDPEASDDYPLEREDWVDLGLPSGTLWARCNVGAYSPQSAGLYFSWGNIQGHAWIGSAWADGYSFTQDTYNQTPGFLLAGNIDNAHDAAREYLGEHWKIPTLEQVNELIENVITEKINLGTVVCLRLISKVNYNFIILPLIGFGSGSSISFNGARTYLWTSTFLNYYYNRILLADSNKQLSVSVNARYSGCNIRPIYVP